MTRLIRAVLAVTLLALATCSPAHAADFAPIWKNTIKPHEGGYTADRRDPGNWTGGKVGAGKLLGTNRGIAANTYGVELARHGKTIKGLSEAECAALYERDYFRRLNLHLLKSQGIADELTDEAVNMGPAGAERLLAKVFAEVAWASRDSWFKSNPPPARVTPATIAWINDYTKSRDNRVAFFNSIRMKRVAFYVNLVKHKPSMNPFFVSWIDRTVD